MNDEHKTYLGVGPYGADDHEAEETGTEQAAEPAKVALPGEPAPVFAGDEHPPGFDGTTDGSLSALAEDLLKNFRGARFTSALAAELLDHMAEGGHLAGTRRASEPTEGRWRTVASRLVKVIYYLKPKMEGAGITKSATALYAALHVWDMPEFDALNSHQNMQQFADSVIVRWIVTTTNGREQRTPEFLTKQAVNNAVLDAQKHFQLQPRKDQRETAAKEKMRQARHGQLKP
jgi:hypothetical protein